MLDKSIGPFRRALQYAYYDWTREMPRPRRILAWTGILMQGYAVYCILTRSLVWAATRRCWRPTYKRSFEASLLLGRISWL